MIQALPADREALVAAMREDPRLGPLLARVDAAMDDDPGHDLAHVLRVALWTLRIGADAIDPDEGVAAALLHDIVNVPKNSPDRGRASELCAAQARSWLPEHGFDKDAIERIADAIRDHSFSRGAVPQSPLGQALQDADRLEALGVIGLFRCISTGSRMGARYFHDADPWAVRGRARDDRAYSIDHFFEKLLGLHATMNTAAGRAEALRRTAYLEATLTQLGDEIGEAY